MILGLEYPKTPVNRFLSQGKPWPDDVAEWLQSNRPKIVVDENKCTLHQHCRRTSYLTIKAVGYISSHDSIIQQRTHALLEAVAQQDNVEREEHRKQTAILEAGQGGYQHLPMPPIQHNDQGDNLPPDRDIVPSIEGSTTEPMRKDSEGDATKPSTTEAPPLPTTPVKTTTTVDTTPSSKSQSHDQPTGAETVTEGRQHGSSVQFDGRVYLGNGKENRYITYPHMVISDQAASGCGVTCLTMSLPTNRVATTCEDCAVRVWDIASGALLMKLDEHQKASVTAVFSPDGARLVSGGKDHRGVLWNLSSHTKIASLEGHTDELCAVDYSPDGKFIATGSVDCKVKVWDGVDGTPLFTVPEDHPAAVIGVHFSPNSHQLLTCAENIVFLWNAQDGSPIVRLEGHMGVIWGARYSADGSRIVTGSEDNTARIWDANGGAELVTLADNEGPVWAVAFSPDGEDVVLGTDDGRVTVHSSWSGEVKHSFEDDHPSIVDSIEYSSDGEMIVAGYVDGSAKLWSATNDRFIAELLGHDDKCRRAMFSPDGEHIISGSDDSTIRIWNIVDLLQL